MCCIQCQSNNKVEAERGRRVVDKDNKGARQTKSLLFGSWELISEENAAAFLHYISRWTMTEAPKYFTAKKQFVHIKPSDHENVWLYRTETEAMKGTFMIIEFGIEKHELTPFHIPAEALYKRIGLNEITARYAPYDFSVPICTVNRKVKWWRPNRLITEVKFGSATSIRKYKRIDRN